MAVVLLVVIMESEDRMMSKFPGMKGRDCYNREACIEDTRKYGMGPSFGVRIDSSGFAPGPHHDFSQQSSSGGWLNE